MTATEDLRSEHVGVGRMLDIMDAMGRRAGAGEQPGVDDLEQTIEFLRVFVDKCHHTKEEDLLFRAIRAANMTATEATIVVLLADHRHGREAVGRIESAAQRLARGESANRELADTIAGYTELLRAHIRREEDDCFDPADHELPLAVQEELIEGYERIEREVVGEGVHARFHALIDRLALTYQV
jgi:hemerythrin-like domain-containing protein